MKVFPNALERNNPIEPSPIRESIYEIPTQMLKGIKRRQREKLSKDGKNIWNVSIEEKGEEPLNCGQTSRLNNKNHEVCCIII